MGIGGADGAVFCDDFLCSYLFKKSTSKRESARVINRAFSAVAVFFSFINIHDKRRSLCRIYGNVVCWAVLLGFG